MAEKNVISHHIFMFPFTIDANSASFLEKVENSLLKNRWERKGFSPQDNNARYSEFFYFHTFVRDVIFDRANLQDQNGVMRYFNYPLGENPVFKIYINNKDNKQEIYELKIKKISLRIVETQVGILALELENHDYHNFDDIIKINDYGRRIYPQFLGKEEDGGIKCTKKAFLADKIEVDFGLGEDPVIENFSEDEFQKDHLVTASYIQKLLGNDFTTNPKEKDKGKMVYEPVIDDRMFVVCWHGSDSLARELVKPTKDGGLAYETSDKWFRFIFSDGQSVTCPNEKLRKKILTDSTYTRWITESEGTFYGLSRTSLVCLSPRSDFRCNVIREHMRRHYAQMAAILLTQRASLLRFSDRVAKISHEIHKLKNLQTNKDKTRDEPEIKEISEKVSELHAAYISFINLLWFTEITPQDQGIEMYDMAVKNMDLKDGLKELQGEIKELYEYVSLTQDRLENQKMNTLTALGAVFLPLTVVTGIFGINLYFMEHGFSWLFRNSSFQYFFSIVIFCVISWLAYAIMHSMLKQFNKGTGNISDYITLKFIKIIGKDMLKKITSRKS
ncbi:hypothetical protein KFV02_04795 [Desulfohalobiaceae bacterium Ax17]|uniref:CorA family divalent cation transporter n=1 Tax=Desulfovulcanus ferrireducens TaxID=2831190 RepID=UPI00207BA35C|nr:CorA family divalent cation transporter [Desulfovulcanus ferrireducens]MBT8763246.1 hypothetical protein [Desulfovulcanus ferrireducens]